MTSSCVIIDINKISEAFLEEILIPELLIEENSIPESFIEDLTPEDKLIKIFEKKYKTTNVVISKY